MRRDVYRWLGLAVLPVLFAGCDPDVLIYGPNVKVKKAEHRVERVFDGIQKSGGKMTFQVQEAISQWDRGIVVIRDDGEMEVAMDAFADWIAKKGMLNKGVKSWEITDVSPHEKVADAMVVTVKVDGRRKLKVQVKDRERMRWMR